MQTWFCCSGAKLCPTVCNPRDCCMPGSSLLHSLGVCSNSCPLSWWCYLIISSSAASFSFCLQSFPAFFQWLGSLYQVAKILELQHPMNIQAWFPFKVKVLVAQLCPTLCDPMDCSVPGFPVLHYVLNLLKFMSVELAMLSNHLILCQPLLLLPSIFPSIRVFSNELVLHIRWTKYWSFSCSISSSNEYSGLISFRID